MGQFILWLLIIIIALIIGAKSVIIVHQANAVIVERLGQFSRKLEPGLHVIVPFIEAVRKVVDLREQVWDYPSQDVITKDNVAVKIDNVMYYMITDPVKSVYEVQDVDQAILKLSQTTIRDICGNLTLDELLTSRQVVNEKLRSVVDKATDPWGIKVTRVELKAINPPPEILEAMTKQMKAERDKRALILESEGVKQSAILKAEGEKQAKILSAQGEAQAIITVAKARADAVRVYFDGIHQGNPTKDVIAIQYLNTLEKVSQGTATKIFLPYESSAILGSLGTIKEIFVSDKEKESNNKPEKSK